MTACDHRHLATESSRAARQRAPLGTPDAEVEVAVAVAVAVAVNPERFRDRFISLLASYP